MAPAYTSNELFHFVGHANPDNHEFNYEVLLKILRSGYISHPPHENNCGKVSHKIYWEKSLLDEGLIVPTVTCYADIPLASLEIHVKKYGKFGVSFSRDFLTQYGARPVMYIPLRNDDWRSINGATLLKHIEAVYKGFYDVVVSKFELDKSAHRTLGEIPATEANAVNATNSILAKDFLAFIKPFDSLLPWDHPDNFYMERECRKHGNLEFNSENVERIIVAEGYSSRLETEFPQFKDKVIEL